MIRFKVSSRGLFFILLIILFTFQNALETVWHAFSYIDEFAGCIAFVLIINHWGFILKRLEKRLVLLALFAMLLFLISGLAGNFIYQYQPLSFVIVDLFTNIKFYLTFVTGYLIFVNVPFKTLESSANVAARFATIILFFTFILDRLLNLYGGEIRHGIRSANLFYSHSTYFAGALVFLLILLTIFYKQYNLLFICLDTVMLIFTMRSKAIVAAAAYLFLFWHIVIRKRQLKIRQLVLTVPVIIALGWEQINFYFIHLAGRSARSIMTVTSIKIMLDYFPIGTGFGTFASHSAAAHYSPVYLLYDFTDMWDVSINNPSAFLDDTFWPIIFGQTGFIGTMAYLFLLFIILRKCWCMGNTNVYMYSGTMFIITYLLISSMAEPAFNNSVAIPLAFLLGFIFQYISKDSENACNKGVYTDVGFNHRGHTGL